jgi:hypothetical protein
VETAFNLIVRLLGCLVAWLLRFFNTIFLVIFILINKNVPLLSSYKGYYGGFVTRSSPFNSEWEHYLLGKFLPRNYVEKL